MGGYPLFVPALQFLAATASRSSFETAILRPKRGFPPPPEKDVIKALNVFKPVSILIT